MSSQLTEEPEALQDSWDVVRETPKPSQNSSGAGPSLQDDRLNESGMLGMKWDGDQWTDEIVKHACVLNSTARLESRIADFAAVATPEEQEILASSREKVIRIRGEALAASQQGSSSATSGDAATFGERVRTAWSATVDVAYEYVQMLDVVVGQAPEYVGLAYGAIKIILVVQINHEEVKRKVKDYLEQVQLKFRIIDHLTSYIPSAQLVALVAQAYSLFYRFLAKAIKYYTQSRPKTWIKAVTKPWKRFQDLVDSINQTLDNVKEVAQYTGILEGHVNTVVSRRNLFLLQQNSARMEKVMQLVKELSTKVETTSIQFSKRADVRQAEGALRQSTEERLSEPRLLGDRDQESHRTDDDLLVVESSINLDSLRDVLFSELHEADGQVRRNLRANEELPEMRAFRSERRNFNKSEMALAWAESHRSEILWVDGYQALTRADFNASFVFPLLQLVESRFDTVVSLRHFCENHHDGSDKYLVMMQSLVWQFLRQNPSIAQRKRASLDRERTSTTRGLWVILSELLEESKAKCVFLVIGGIDSLVNDSSNPRGLMTDMINQFHGLISQLVKIILTRGLPQPQTTTTDQLYSLVVHKHHGTPKRKLSLDAMESRLPAIYLQLTEIQEKRCQDVSFMQLPMLYTPGSILYTQEQDFLHAFVISELSGMEQMPSGSYKALKIRVWCIDHDGTYICKRYRDFEVSYFSGRRNITTSLKYVPAGYLLDEPTRRQKLITRGRHYWSLGSGHHYRQIKRNKPSWKDPQRVIVDQSRRPISSHIALQFAEQFQPEQGINVKPRFLALTPAKVEVYDLKKTAWVTVALETLTDVKFSSELHRSLILGESQRKLLIKTVKSFCDTPTRTSEDPDQIHDSYRISRRDSSSSKDEEEPPNHDRGDWQDGDDASDSLVLLLHGGPGTGKTMTARFVANYTHRPLFSLSLAKLGADVTELAWNTREISILARQWGCIVQLKHADAFLARRSPRNGSLEENMVTMVLLQIIEDFEGVLILTTNEFDIIDEALKSRIHLALFLATLNSESQSKIWLDLIHAQQIRPPPGMQNYHKYELEEFQHKDVSRLLKRPMNGRQIHNAVTVAAKRAHSSRRNISLLDLMDALNGTRDIDNPSPQIHTRASTAGGRLPRPPIPDYTIEPQETLE